MTLDQLELRFRGDAQLLPYMVFSAGRSRTMWLSAFLTYGICVCHFEALAKVSSLTEVLTMLSIPGMGAAETLAAPAWPILLTAEPRLRTVVVRRPAEEILASLVAATKDQMQLDLDKLRHLLAYVRRSLDKLSLQPQTLTVDFSELAKEEVCAAVFEHCLPYKHDSGWWKFLAAKNINPDVQQLAALYLRREKEILALGRECRHMLFRLGRQGHFAHLTHSARSEALH
jgi:hypothetical protein